VPTPIGHSLAGLAAGWAVAGLAPRGRSRLIQAAAFAALGAAADLDFLINRHRAETHSIGAAVLVASIAVWRRWPLADSRVRLWWAVWAAWCTHPILDTLALDGGPTIGVMLFWPLSRVYVQTGLSVFMTVWWMLDTPGIVLHTLLAVLQEVAILGPITVAVWAIRGRASASPAPG
jgi:membrane-bound metal-dependent hydrolase YbcI (DUF457 family)